MVILTTRITRWLTPHYNISIRIHITFTNRHITFLCILHHIRTSVPMYHGNFGAILVNNRGATALAGFNAQRFLWRTKEEWLVPQNLQMKQEPGGSFKQHRNSCLLWPSSKSNCRLLEWKRSNCMLQGWHKEQSQRFSSCFPSSKKHPSHRWHWNTIELNHRNETCSRNT
jgi:hypothetical protein